MRGHIHFTKLLAAVNLAFFTLASIGCGVTVSKGTISISKLSISPPTTSVVAGAAEQYTATATYSDGSTHDVSTSVQWSVNDTSVASIGSGGLLTAIAPGTFTATATSGSVASGVTGNVVAGAPPSSGGSGSSGAGTTTSNAGTMPIAVYKGADLSRFPVLNVKDYAASGSATMGTCSGIAGSTKLTCAGLGDLAPGQGIRIVGGGKAIAEAAITEPPVVSPEGNSSGGTHTYCYVVDTVDPLGGISLPSPQTCVANEPALSAATASNFLTTTTSNVGPSPSFLWYVSEDGGPFLLVNTASFESNATDLGQRIGPRGGWPDSLPPANPSIAKQDDLFSTVYSINGNQITINDPLETSVQGATADHDDTQAVENAILASLPAGGATIVFGPGTFNIRRPAFEYVVNNSFACPPYTTNLSWDPWWARYSYLYVPNGSTGNLNFLGAGRTTTIVTPPDHGGLASLLSVGAQARGGVYPVLSYQEIAAGATQVTLTSAAAASSLSPGDDIMLFSGTFRQAPDVDPASGPDVNHFSEINTVASVSDNIVQLVYPTSKRFFDDGGSSYGLTKLLTTPHNIELQHLNIITDEPITAPGTVFGMLVNDLQIQGVLSQGAFGGGYKRGVTIMDSQWTFGQGTSGWGQTDEYDQFTDLAFLNNTISGYAAPGSEGPSGMAKIYATEGTSEVLFEGNTFDHVSVYADQTNSFYVQNNTFTDGIIAAGTEYGEYTASYDGSVPGDRSFLSFGSQGAFSADHNSFTITSDFTPPWVIRAGNFSSGNISNNSITYNGARAPQFLIASFGGVVSNNTISIQTETAHDIIALVPDQSPSTPLTSFTAEGNATSANIIHADVMIPNPGFTDTAPVCVQHNLVQAAQGVALKVASTIVNQRCP